VVMVLIAAFLAWAPSRTTPALRRRAHEPLPASLVRTLLFLASATTLGAAAAGAVSAYAVTAAIDRGISDASAGVLLSAGSLLGAVCRVVVGVVADRVGGRVALPLASALLGAGAVGAVLLVVPDPVVYSIGIVLALGPGWGWTGLTHYVVARIAGPATPSATGIVQTGSYLGSGGGPLVFGIVYAALDGAPIAWIAVAGGAVVAAGLAWTLSRRLAPVRS
jgi:cyanate permease